MNKLISTKITSAIFLIIVLVTGTIAAISPSFIIKGVNAQGDPYYGMDNRYNSYGPTEYPDNNSYNSYESDYGMDSYDKPIYDDKKLYDDKPIYPSYGKDDRDKSKDSKKSVNINKIKCINTNLNINGENAGNVSIGNKGQGYLGTYSSADRGYGGDDGYSKQGKGFECIINNNNNNTNIVSGGAGNVTEPEPPIDADCEAGIACFVSTLDPTQLGNLKFVLGLPVNSPNELLCTVIDDLTAAELRAAITAPVVGVTDAVATVIINCLIDAGFTNLE